MLDMCKSNISIRGIIAGVRYTCSQHSDVDSVDGANTSVLVVCASDSNCSDIDGEPSDCVADRGNNCADSTLETYLRYSVLLLLDYIDNVRPIVDYLFPPYRGRERGAQD